MLKTAFFVFLAKLSEVLFNLFLIKLIANYLGPEGLGYLGHFIGFFVILKVLSGGSIENGVVKYISEFRDKPIMLRYYLSDSILYMLCASFLIFIVVFLFAEPLSLFIFKTISYSWLIYFASLLQFLIAFNKLALSISNAYGYTHYVTISSLTSNVLGAGLCWVLVKQQEELGVIIGVILIPIIAFLPLLYFFLRAHLRVGWAFVLRRAKKTKCMNGNLLRFSLVGIVSAFSFPISEMIIRELAIQTIGYQSVGIWQAGIKISSAYLSFFSMFMLYYLLPKISPMTVSKEILITIKKFNILTISIFSIGALFLYFQSNYFIVTLLSNDFLELKGFLPYLLLGDILKLITFSLCFTLLAKAHLKKYIFLEITQNALFIIINGALISLNSSLEGMYLAYISVNAIYLIVVLLLFYSTFKLR